MRGSIRSEEAYALGKMLDHSGWHVLPRAVTPSDIDMVFDNGGWILYCEISSEHSQWENISKGQRILYRNEIWRTKHCAILCKHSVSLGEGRAINTHDDICDFQVMLHEAGRYLTTDVLHNWDEFVGNWFANPRDTRQFCANSAKRIAA